MKLDPDIAELDLAPIAFKACVEQAWEVSEVDTVEMAYRAFLQAIRDNPGTQLAPSKKVDLFWHHHILDTSKYIEDCQILFGRYIHHYPYSGIFDDDDAKQQKERFDRTQILVQNIM